jgi:hypothetical protein
MELGDDPSELLNALDDASCLEAAVPHRRVGSDCGNSNLSWKELPSGIDIAFSSECLK